jgi:hypothetical protein
MPEIKFELSLPDGPRSAFVVVAGGADADHDGTIEDNAEVSTFTRDGNTWSHNQRIDDPVSGTRFFVTFTIGQDVRWELVIKNDAGAVLYRNQNTTVFHTSEIRWHLP